jgi:hypothetical protein
MNSEETVEIEFVRGQADAKKLQQVVDKVLAELGDDSSDTAKAARKAGLEPGDLAGITVREGAQGADPLLTPIIVMYVGNVTVHIANTFWDEVLWPRIRKRWGGLAVKGKKEQKGKKGKKNDKGKKGS